MNLSISHTTTYTYDQPVYYALQQVRLTPKDRSCQNVLDWNIEIEGGKIELEFDDQHNNRVVLVSCDPGQETLIVSANGMVETSDSSGVIGRHGGYAPLWYFTQTTDLTKPGKLVRNLVSTIRAEEADNLERLHLLSNLVLQQITYQTGKTRTDTTAEEALADAVGVCQDHAHAFISAARLMGYPTRYVSGYLMLNDRVEQDATHAWVETYVEDLGWVGFDISNGISPDERYVPVATGLDYTEAAPISGMRFGDSTESMIVSLQVQQ
ncbi:MAG: transglutaminase family protein [Rhizobiaceae bacterium]|nr:transglutaminase family protein [Rhizobiaceae bacterium]